MQELHTWVDSSGCLCERQTHTTHAHTQENALEWYRRAFEKTVALGHRLDIIFALIRVGLFYMDHDVINRNIEKAKR